MKISTSKAFSLGLLSSLTFSACQKAEHSQPNVILMLADDMGYDDMSLRGNTCVETPNLDWLAQNSTSFDNFYVHSVSAPTRASLLTGRHFLRTGVSGVHAGRDFVNLDEVTVAEAFQYAGYETGMWGKWHSGKTSGYFPWERGFDEAFMAELYHYRDNIGLLNGKTHQLQGWTDAAITDMAINFIKKNRGKKFFAYIPYLSPHGEWDAPDDIVKEKIESGQSENFATLNAMIDHLDTQVGRIIKTVEDQGLSDNTIIIFMSDNGPIHSVGPQALTEDEWKLRNPSQYRGNKGQNFENGIRSPLFVYWKGKFQAGINKSLLSVDDIFPTLCDLAGIPLPAATKPLDGRSFKELLNNPTIEKFEKDVFISQWHPYFEYQIPYHQEVPLSPSKRASIDPTIQQIGVRRGHYKVLLNQWGEDTIAMWNLGDDYAETNNLYHNGSEDEKQSSFVYRDIILDWYNDILHSEKSYQMPEFQIGLESKGETQILCYAPIEMSEGLTNEILKISGFDKAGERIEYRVNVVKEKKYSIGLQVAEQFKEEARFKVFTNKQDSCGVITLVDNQSSFLPLKLTKDVNRLGLELMSNVDSTLALKHIRVRYRHHYESTEESLALHIQQDEWLKDAKVGLVYCMGPYSVPSFKSNNYSRQMYISGSDVRDYHIKTYGRNFHYHEFVPLFKAEKFDPQVWAEVVSASGAKFAGIVAESYDGFSMWDSNITPWNAKNMGPERDVLGEFFEELKVLDIHTIATLNHSRNLQRYQESWKLETKAEVFNNDKFINSTYPYLREYQKVFKDPDNAMLYGTLDEDEWCREVWLGKLKEVIDGYHPDIIWMDDWKELIPDDIDRQFKAHYLNAAGDVDQDVVIVESMDDVLTLRLQNEVIIDSIQEVIYDLVDIVSKGGSLLLEVSSEADGSILEELQENIVVLGEWLSVNGEAIYSTRPWTTTEEGDIRYTASKGGNVIYAILPKQPAEGESFVLKSFKGLEPFDVKSLSGDRCEWSREENGLSIKVSEPKGEYAYVLKVYIESDIKKNYD